MHAYISEALAAFDLEASRCIIERIGTGHINQTYRVDAKSGSFVLQGINTAVFRQPALIEQNMVKAAEYLKAHSPDYLFLAPLPTRHGAWSVTIDHRPWRLFPFLQNTFTIDRAETAEQAHEAAAGFARLTRLLHGAPVEQFQPTIERFHDLTWRYQQFEQELDSADAARKDQAREVIEIAIAHRYLVERYQYLIGTKVLTLGVFHNDTKINNILFDTSGKTKAVIDLDTLMPGYFVYDLGDLLRTLVSPVTEEEADLTKIDFRPQFYEAVLDGYLSEMSVCLRAEEVRQCHLAGPVMTYIMALRFLADFLRGDTYYHTTYPGQNLVRARNQLMLLQLFLAQQPA